MLSNVLAIRSALIDSFLLVVLQAMAVRADDYDILFDVLTAVASLDYPMQIARTNPTA